MLFEGVVDKLCKLSRTDSKFWFIIELVESIESVLLDSTAADNISSILLPDFSSPLEDSACSFRSLLSVESRPFEFDASPIILEMSSSSSPACCLVFLLFLEFCDLERLGAIGFFASIVFVPADVFEV